MKELDLSHFMDQLAQRVLEKNCPVVVGLDPRWSQLPAPLRESAAESRASQAEAYASFACQVCDVVAPLVPAVKPQMAFFEALGVPGMQALANVIRYAQELGLLVILDGKRNDIGSTAAAYADGLLGREHGAWGGDALTVSPYLGDDSLQPFVDTAAERGCGIFVLVKTSNQGGGQFQDLVSGGLPIYRHVATHVESLAAATRGAEGYGLIGAVVGATYPEQLVELRKAMPHTWFLIPGFGSQGGTAAAVAPVFDDRGLGAIVNSSRAIIFAYERPEYRQRYTEDRWQDAVAAATEEMIGQLRAATTAR